MDIHGKETLYGSSYPCHKGVTARVFVEDYATMSDRRSINQNQDQAKLRSERERDLAILVNVSPATTSFSPNEVLARPSRPRPRSVIFSRRHASTDRKIIKIPDSPAAQDYEVAEYNSSKGLKTNT